LKATSLEELELSFSHHGPTGSLSIKPLAFPFWEMVGTFSLNTVNTLIFSAIANYLHQALSLNPENFIGFHNTSQLSQCQRHEPSHAAAVSSLELAPLRVSHGQCFDGLGVLHPNGTSRPLRSYSKKLSRRHLEVLKSHSRRLPASHQEVTLAQ
jgi:hypothetical protein